ncbi:hypothetical protein [Nonomuraea sp. NPDC050786]|uniref:hypothetical protein n=1 Tax=Nonomuraea sp. NPDC050786 TaxID=3154840 RepID=UPI0033F014EB
MDIGLAVPQFGRFAALPSVLRVAREAGRDPAALHMVLRANPVITDRGVPPLSGTVAQISAYLATAAEAGVHEVVLDLQHTAMSDQHLLDLAGDVRARLGPDVT